MSTYFISEAAHKMGVEAHVLRFWEEELELEIPRTEQGHRCYGEEQMKLFETIKIWKEGGMSLKEIKEKLNQKGLIQENSVKEEKKDFPVPEKENFPASLDRGDRLIEFESILYDIVSEALRNNNEKIGKAVSQRVNDKLVKEMNYLMRENEESMETHFRKLDEALIKRGRLPRLALKETAAAKSGKPSFSLRRKRKKVYEFR